jgi:hypothetical protein
MGCGMRLPVRLGLALSGGVLWLSAAACSGAASSPGTVKVAGQSVPAGQLSAVAEAVCRAAGEATGDPAAAGQTFLGQAHDGIHLIARGLQGVDRHQSARVLVAKQAVEADLADRASGAKLAADLNRLAGETRSGLARLGLAVPPCANPRGPSPSAAHGG